MYIEIIENVRSSSVYTVVLSKMQNCLSYIRHLNLF